MTEPYDSTEDTMTHRMRVMGLLDEVTKVLANRGREHDESKLHSPEKEVFDEFTPKLKDSTYGSDEYAGFLVGMKPGLDLHYAENRHHPEHCKDGVKGMSLLDLIEMLAYWKAAG
jgi:hypothetical protein